MQFVENSSGWIITQRWTLIVATYAIYGCLAVALNLVVGNAVLLNLGFVPRIAFSAHVETPLMVTALLSGWLFVRAQGELAAGFRPAHALALSLILAAMINSKQSGIGLVAALVGAAVVVGVGDIVTCPLSLAPLWGERPWRVLVMVARQAYVIEAAQYLLGVLGALAVRQQLWTAILLVLPTVLVYLAFRAMARAEEARGKAEEARRMAARLAALYPTWATTAAEAATASMPYGSLNN